MPVQSNTEWPCVYDLFNASTAVGTVTPDAFVTGLRLTIGIPKNKSMLGETDSLYIDDMSFTVVLLPIHSI